MYSPESEYTGNPHYSTTEMPKTLWLCTYSVGPRLGVHCIPLLISGTAATSGEVPIELFDQPHQSKPFNPTMAAVFYKCGFIENWGRGTLNIIDYCLEADLLKPEFAYTRGVVRTFFYKKQQVADPVRGQVGEEVLALLQVMSGEIKRAKIMGKLTLSGRGNFVKLHLSSALKLGLIEMTLPDKPNSRLQKYRLTELGKKVLEARKA